MVAVFFFGRNKQTKCGKWNGHLHQKAYPLIKLNTFLKLKYHVIHGIITLLYFPYILRSLHIHNHLGIINANLMGLQLIGAKVLVKQQFFYTLSSQISAN